MSELFVFLVLLVIINSCVHSKDKCSFFECIGQDWSSIQKEFNKGTNHE